MNSSISPGLRSVLPPDGIAFRCAEEEQNPIVVVSGDLCRITGFLQEHGPYARLRRFDDWWEHDGLHFEKGPLDIGGLFEIVGTPRSLLASMPGDHRVFVAVGPADHSWYLRFFADWDDAGEALLGEYSITLSHILLGDFEVDVLPQLKCHVEREEAASYFRRIGV